MKRKKLISNKNKMEQKLVQINNNYDLSAQIFFWNKEHMSNQVNAKKL
ncbi:MAG: hypothetical protein IPQ04_15315 [Saprospiraceae bacterium]|nr:hypothetical protein [Saprospiraceae bacterium]